MITNDPASARATTDAVSIISAMNEETPRRWTGGVS